MIRKWKKKSEISFKKSFKHSGDLLTLSSLDILNKITSVSSLIFFLATPPLKLGQLNIAGLSYGQQGAPIVSVSPGTFNKGWSRE